MCGLATRWDSFPPAPGDNVLRQRLRRSRPAGHARLHIQQSADAAHQFIDIQRFVQKIVGPRFPQLLDLVFLDHPRDADDLDVRHRRVAPDQLADRLAVDVRQHDVKDDQVGMILLGEHARPRSRC